jgi:hypothetical protein
MWGTFTANFLHNSAKESSLRLIFPSWCPEIFLTHLIKNTQLFQIYGILSCENNMIPRLLFAKYSIYKHLNCFLKI